jgi:hypothetical protein
MDAQHSRVFAVTRWFREAIAAATFTPNEHTARIPETSAVLIGQDQPGEYVSVVNEVEDDHEIQWVTLGAKGRDETFRIRVVIFVAHPGLTDVQVETRLEELAEVVQGVLYDPTTRQVFAPDVEGVIEGMTRVSQLQYGIWTTREGFAGSAELLIQVRARI